MKKKPKKNSDGNLQLFTMKRRHCDIQLRLNFFQGIKTPGKYVEMRLTAVLLLQGPLPHASFSEILEIFPV